MPEQVSSGAYVFAWLLAEYLKLEKFRERLLALWGIHTREMWRSYAWFAAALSGAQYSQIKLAGAVITSGADEILAELSITDDTTGNAGCPTELPYGTATNADGTTPTIDQFMVRPVAFA